MVRMVREKKGRLGVALAEVDDSRDDGRVQTGQIEEKRFRSM